MDREKLLYSILALSVIMAMFEFIAQSFYLYWTLWWFDLVMHFLGGLLVSLGAIWTVFYSGYLSGVPILTERNALSTSLLAALFIGGGWEMFEYVYSLRDVDNYILDTGTDLIMDVLGAAGAYGVIAHFEFRAVLQ